ncbi:MAG: hypothetical protein IJM82_00130 [Synergistaceae bacterium]|nr:hypothetical protein [Synergistaceae bacterium]MBQ6435257.1 hypothetical protein [Synergistaceae bacterium]MBQ7067554.1 hypothetical protein [Synergistaceae bacterium]MBR0075299.1 hypothetical protein [Synergistaceae bacterium]MBR0253023.1 hypothetical protein [Synergistaceae bacterium]
MIEKVYDDFEDELDAIRLALYEEIKDMTPEEQVAYIHEQTAPIIKELGLKYSTLQPVQPRKRERVPI